MMLDIFTIILPIISLLIGFLIGKDNSQAISKQKKTKTGFALHPERINRAGRPRKEKKNESIDDEEIGVVKYKSIQEKEEEKDISKKGEEEAMTESLRRIFDEQGVKITDE